MPKTKPKKQKLAPSRGVGHGREKPFADWNRGVRKDKINDDLTRMFFYIFRGYEGPHPWGIQARPPYPEYRPLKVVDKTHGAPYRKVIETHLRKPAVQQRFLRTLVELQDLLRRVDPRNPKLIPSREVLHDPY